MNGLRAPGRPSSSRNLSRDPVADLVYAVPDDDEFLRRWRSSKSTDAATNDARRQYSDFFHAPGCYGETTNFASPPADMSLVNNKLFDVFRESYLSGLPLKAYGNGTATVQTDDYTFFRFSITPVDPTNNARAQEWAFQANEKVKSEAISPRNIRVELQTTPKTSTSKSVVFVRTHDARVTIDAFLNSQSFAQSLRTKAAAKAMTGVSPISLVHAELLIDAAIEKRIITARLQSQVPLPNFWKLPVEVRGRVYQLATGAEGDIWPVDFETYHRRHRALVWDKVHAIARDHGFIAHGVNLVFGSGLILPQAFGALFSQRNLAIFGWEDGSDGANGNSIETQGYRAFTTPDLLRTSKLVRQEVIQTLFVQPTFCFSEVSQLHGFMEKTLDDALSSWRKLRLTMDVQSLLIVFSVARRHLSDSELDLLHELLQLAGTGSSRSGHATMPRHPSMRPSKAASRLEQDFEDNDAIFVQRAEFMRFTLLTLEVTSPQSPGRSPLPTPGIFGMPPADRPADSEKLLHLGRLLLVKLVNLTLDLWAQRNDSRPQLRLIWQGDIDGSDLEALDIMNKVYATTEVTVE